MGIGPVLETAIAVIFIYIVLSIIAIGITDIIVKLTQLRAKTLRKGLRVLINSNSVDLVKDVYDNYLIKGLNDRETVKKESLPTCLPRRNFAQALMKAVADKAPQQHVAVVNGVVDIAQTFTRHVESTDNDFLKSLRPIVQEAGGKVTVLREKLEEWFDQSTTTMTEYYKRRTRVIALVIGVIVAVVLNVDTFTMVNAFWHDGRLRGLAVAAAGELASKPLPVEAGGTQPAPAEPAAAIPAGRALAESTPTQAPDTLPASENMQLTSEAQAVVDDFMALPLPIGWSAEYMPGNVGGWLMRVLGWLFTAVAVCLGAPFWYDILQRLIGLRSAAKKKEEPAAS